MVGNLSFETLVKLVDSVGLVGALIADGAFSGGFVLIDHAVAHLVFIDTEGFGLADVLADEEASDFLRGEMMSHIPLFEILDGLGLFFGNPVGSGERRIAMGTALQGLINHRSAIVTFDFHDDKIKMKQQN